MPKYKVNIKYWQENAFNELNDIIDRNHFVNPKLKGVMEMSEIANKVIKDNPHLYNNPEQNGEIVFGGLHRYWSKDKKKLIVTYGMAKGWAYLTIERNKK
jgi:hypothetical protein